MDIGLMMKLSGMWLKFSRQHPKFPQFMKSLQSHGVPVDSVIDIKITYPDGQVIDTNLKITPDDIKAIEELKKIKK